GDFRRDYIFRFCTWADLPHQVDQPEAKKLWGDPFLDKKAMDEAIRTQEITEEDLLEKQLARTQIKQEKDVVEQFKRVEDVDLRQKALEQHKQGYQGQEGTWYSPNCS
uniref:Calreticulin n=1 Tax=Panagrolaimus sp. PS1159 TaxID=55785 RepID=A0AC35F1C6_9BILA